jgi:hypothetical protein
VPKFATDKITGEYGKLIMSGHAPKADYIVLEKTVI